MWTKAKKVAFGNYIITFRSLGGAASCPWRSMRWQYHNALNVRSTGNSSRQVGPPPRQATLSGVQRTSSAWASEHPGF
jgi:hypothetical protein